jgi:O-antigen/teichoic acid export membrane protein
LIPYFSYYGSAVATLAAYAIMMLISYVLGKKYYPIPYDYKLISKYLFLSVFLSFVSFYLFRENYIVGPLLLVAFIYYVYRNEQTVIQGILRRKK